MIGLGSDKDGKVVMGIMALIGNGKIASNPPNPDDLVVVGECSVSLHKRIYIHLFNAFSYYSSFIYLFIYIHLLMYLLSCLHIFIFIIQNVVSTFVWNPHITVSCGQLTNGPHTESLLGQKI